MNPVQIHETFKSVLSFLSDGKINNAIDKCSLLTGELQEGEYTDRLNELKENYQLLLRYFLDGVTDPQRKQVYNKIIAQIFTLNCELREELMLRNSSNYEYLQKRYFPHRLRFSTITGLKDSLLYFHQIDGEITSQARITYEQLLVDVFAIFWLSTFYGNFEQDFFKTIIADNYNGKLEASMAVSALTLNLWRMFDEEKLMLLLDCCSHSNIEIKQRALVGLCFVLARYNRFIPYFPIIRNRLVLLADDEQTLTNFKNILIQIIGTVETDKISKKLREEILPEIMKVSPLIKDKLDADHLLNSEEWGRQTLNGRRCSKKVVYRIRLRNLLIYSRKVPMFIWAHLQCLNHFRFSTKLRIGFYLLMLHTVPYRVYSIRRKTIFSVHLYRTIHFVIQINTHFV